MKAPELTPEIIRQFIRFEPETGKYFWRERPLHTFASEAGGRAWNAKRAGKETMNTFDEYNGYLKVAIYRKSYCAHRIVWAYHYGVWPSGSIDHINGDRADNRLENLRDVSQAENQRNRRPNSNNTSGVNGVFWNKARNKWGAAIHQDGKKINLGLVPTKEAAIALRKSADLEYGYHENHGQSLSRRGRERYAATNSPQGQSPVSAPAGFES